MSETTLIQALAAAQLEMKNAAFDSSVKYGNTEFKFASLGALREAVVPVLTKHGIAVTQPSHQLDSGAWVIRTTLHKGDQTLSGDMPIIASDNKAQGFGSGVTYAKRYGLAAMVCIASDEDDDGGEAAKAPLEMEFVTISQADEIEQNIKRLGADKSKFLNHFKVPDVTHLTTAQFLKAKEMLDERERRAVADATA